MSNTRDMGTLNQLYRELSTIVTVPTLREVQLQSELERIFILTKPQALPGETPLDAARRLIVDGITYNEIREVEHLEAQQQRVQKGWAKSNGLVNDG